MPRGRFPRHTKQAADTTTPVSIELVLAWFTCALPIVFLGATAAAYGASTWVAAIKANDTAELSRLLAVQNTIDEPAPDGKTALMAASAAGDAELVTRLIARGSNPHRTNKKGATALIYASWGGSLVVAHALLDRQIDLDQRASNGWTAVTMAAAKGHVDFVRLLLQAGAAAGTPDIYGWTPLMRAVDRQREAVVALLIAYPQVNLMAINDRGQTALHIAAAIGNQAVYKILKDAGCDPNRPDFDGVSALTIAGANGLEQ